MLQRLLKSEAVQPPAPQTAPASTEADASAGNQAHPVKSDQLDAVALELRKRELAISERQTTYRFVEIVFGTLVLGILGIAFNWANFRREGATDDRKFLADHLITAMQEKDPHVRRQKISDLIAIRDRSRSVLEEKQKEAETDAAAEDAEKREQQRLQKEAEAAKTAEDKKQADIRLAAAKEKAAKEKAARERDRRDFVERLRDGYGGGPHR